MKTIRSLMHSGLMALLVSVPMMASAASEPLQLRLSVESTPGSATQYMLASFRDSLKDELGDQVQIEYFDSGTIGDEIVHMQQVRSGQLDVVPIGSDAVQLDSKWAVFDIPFLFEDRDQVAKVFDGEIGEELDRSFQESAGLKILGFGELGFRQISNNVRAIHEPEDLEGMKLRVPGSRTRILAFQQLGAEPVEMNIGEVYLAMQQGVIDGQENPLGNIYNHSWYEVSDYVSLTRHVYTPITFVMNLDRYESLTDEQRSAVDRAARTAVEESREYGIQNDNSLVEKIKEKSDVQFNDVDAAAFKDAAEPIADEIAGIAGEEFTGKVMDAVK